MRWTDDQMHAAAEARDARFDGLFFICVKSTGIYCRPVCPVKPPQRANRRFAPTAAAAEAEGFRPCLRCCPERAPGLAPMDAPQRLARHALAQIEAGVLDEGREEDLARSLAITSRHLRRVVRDTAGASPVALAQTRRLLVAKQLLAETDAPITDIAFAAGFASLRRFNAAFVERYGLNPTTMRRGRAQPAGAGITLRLAYRPPFDLDAQFGWLAARAIAGIERVDGLSWQRTVRVGSNAGTVRVEPGDGHEFQVTLTDTMLPALRTVLSRVRAVFDLDADLTAIDQHLSTDGAFSDRVAARPGVRLPRFFDPFEGLLRTVLGQQVSVAAARTLAGRLVERFGEPLPEARALDGLSHTFPTADTLAALTPDDLQSLGLTSARARTLHTVATAWTNGTIDAAAPDAPDRLLALPGIGPWTRDYAALRVFGDPDAFPAGDLVLQQRLGGQDAAALRRLSERWAPWRAYAAQRLWTQEA